MSIRKSMATGWYHDDDKVQKEFERLGRNISKASADVEEVRAKSGLGNGLQDGEKTNQQAQELSILHNENYVSKDIVKEICFEDNRVAGDLFVPVGIKFDLTEEILQRDKSKVHIKAIGSLNQDVLNRNTMIEKNFEHTDFATSDMFLGVIEANCRIDSVYLRIDSPMSEGQLEVYTDPDNLIILPGSTVPVTIINIYHKNYTIKTFSNSNIFLRFVGATPTHGYGTITIFYHKVQ